MCGIYAAAAVDAQQKVFEGIKRIEYRGYDSWGVAVVTDQGAIELEKQVGKIGERGQLNVPAGMIAIGHTRWATHGGVTQVNAHPHLASDGSFAVVQNGVVENYQQLKQELRSSGYEFKTQTDTEVIVGLLEKEVAGGAVTIDSLAAVCQRLEGRSTVLVLTTRGSILGFRFGSPLVVGTSEAGEFFVSSDVVSLAADATRYYQVANRELIRLSSDALEIARLGEDGSVSAFEEPQLEPITVEATKLDKEGHPHFMLKEIHEQAVVLERVVDQSDQTWEQVLEHVRAANHVYTLGAGSAHFAAGQIAHFLKEKGVMTTAVPSYEAQSFLPLAKKEDVWIVISQSGETADTNEVVEWLKAKGVTIISLVNMAGSTLTSLSDVGCMLQVGPEIGVASTKALSGQMTWGWALSEMLGGASRAQVTKVLQKFQSQLHEWLVDDKLHTKLRSLAEDLARHQHLFILGRSQLYYPALEFALKMKEISYIHAEGFSGGELKHGVIALVEKDTPVVCLVADDDQRDAMLNAAAEVKARGARVIGVAIDQNELFDDWIPLVHHSELQAVASFIPAQLLTYYMALHKGLDPDKPRNLAKSVTVR